MKTKIIALTMTVMLMSLPFADTLYSGMNGNADKLSNDQPNVFSPGYINAAKQKTDAVINQLNPKKSFMERAVAYIQNKVSNKAVEESTDKVQPELKHKTSGTSDANNSASSASSTGSIELPAGGNNDAEIPAYIRDAAQEYITNNLGGASLDSYELRSLNGKYYAIWNEEKWDTNYKNSMKLQIFDSTGNTLYTTPVLLTDHYIDGYGTNDYRGIGNISTFANGDTAVFWSEQDSIYKYSIKSQVFDSYGNTLYATPVALTGDRLLNSASISNVSALDNGNMAVFWEEWDLNYNFSIKTQILGSSGSALYSTPLSITGDRLLSYASMSDVAVLDDGNMAVFWNERDLNSKYSIKSQVFDSTGNALYTTPTSLTGDRLLNEASIRNISTLDNGNMAVFWRERDLNNNYSLKAQVFDSSGSALYDTPTSLADGISFNKVTINNVSTFDNGNMAVFWWERDSNYDFSLKTQILDSSGNTLYDTPTSLADGISLGKPIISNVSTLDNGNIAVFWQERDSNYNFSLKTQILDSSGNVLYDTPTSLTGDRSLKYASINDVSTLANGNIAVFWSEEDSNYNRSLKTQIFDSSGNALYTTPASLTGDRLLGDTSIANVSMLANGNMAVFWGEMNLQYNEYPIKLQVFDPYGNTLYATPFSLSGDGASIINVSTLANGNIAIFWAEGSSLKSQVLSPNGNFVSKDSLRPTTQSPVFSYLDRSILLNPYMNSLGLDTLSNPTYEAFEVNSIMGNKNVSGVFKSLLANKNGLSKNKADTASIEALKEAQKNSLNEYALAIPAMNMSAEDMKIAAVLANILKNPAEDQKLILDTIQAILAETDKAVNQSSSPEDIKKASDDILQAVAAVLIAQAVPDLLKEGDMSNIKGIFSELNEAKGRIMTSYNESTKPYYDETIKELAKNMAMLQLNNIIANSMTKEELMKLPRDEIDKILEKIRQRQNKSFEEEYVLQQDVKYRKKYVEPNNKILEEAMKAMIKDFARRISVMLEGVKARSE